MSGEQINSEYRINKNIINVVTVTLHGKELHLIPDSQVQEWEVEEIRNMRNEIFTLFNVFIDNKIKSEAGNNPQ